MLSNEQLEEIREHLENAGNPIFYYDNDADGLCSFLLLRRFLGRGSGVAVRSYPDLNKDYAKKAKELNADYVFILDKPVVSKEFMDEIESIGLPIVWIDHHIHECDFSEREQFFEFNSAENGAEPVSYLSYRITNRKEDLWISLIGCIADNYLPDFVKDFKKNYRDYWGVSIEKPFDAYYKTEIGRIAQAFNFGLKDSITNVVHMQRFLISCKNPRDVFAEVSGNKNFRSKYSEILGKYKAFLEKARSCIFGNLVFFSYGGDLSISADISNALSYEFFGKYIVVAYQKGAISNVSLRGENVRSVLEKVLEKLGDGSGGGHENAVGARIKTEDLGKFRELLEGEVN
jgi:single-stranded DNA-specific DHH superfamily exonuclease